MIPGSAPATGRGLAGGARRRAETSYRVEIGGVEMGESRRERRRVARPGKQGIRKDLFGPGAVGAWTEEELKNIPPWKAPPELATRDQEDAEALRRGKAIEGRRKRVGSREPGEARPYDKERDRKE